MFGYKYIESLLSPKIAAIYVVFGIFAPLMHAQTVFYNSGELVSIGIGTDVTISGNMQNVASGQFTNNGNLYLAGDFDNSANYNYGTGTIIMNGAGPQAINTNLKDSIYRLNVNTVGPVTLTDTLFIVDSIYLVNGLINSTASNPIQLANACVSVASSSSYINGPADMEGTGTLFFPVGKAANYRPVFLNTVAGSSPMIRFEVFNGDAGGKDSIGIYNLATNQYWQGSVVSGTFTGAGNLELESGAPVNATDVLGQAQTQSGTYISIGNSAASATAVTSDSLWSVSSLGFFVYGSCQRIAGLLSATNLNNPYCFGDTNTLSLAGYDPATVQWQSSLDGLSYTNIASSTIDRLDLLDTLSTATYFKVIVSDGSCGADTSSPLFVNVAPTIKVKVRAFLQGPFDVSGDSMITQLNAAPQKLLDSLYTVGGLGATADTNIYKWASIPVGAVDIVKVEIWEDITADSYPDVKRDSSFAWLLQDGSIANFSNGAQTGYLNFCSYNTPGSYYVVVRHRNHLASMSSTALALNTAIPGSTLDLSLKANNYNGFAKKLNAAGTIYGMYAGNLADDVAGLDVAEINAYDVFIIQKWNAVSPSSPTYFLEDVTLEGYRNSADYLQVEANQSSLVKSEAPGIYK